jgi:hypothetical protein
MIFINTVIVFVGYLCKVDTCTALPIVKSTSYNSFLGIICKENNTSLWLRIVETYCRYISMQ